MNELDENKSEDDEDTEWGTEDDFIIDDEQQNTVLCNYLYFKV